MYETWASSIVTLRYGPFFAVSGLSGPQTFGNTRHDKRSCQLLVITLDK